MVFLSLGFLFPPPPSLFVNSWTLVSFVSQCHSGFSEVGEKHLQYSKFFHAESKEKVERKSEISSRNGMLLAYTPAFLAGVSSFLLYHNKDLRFLLVSLALTIHFLKRITEVLFVHNYSGKMALPDAFAISVNYFSATATTIYGQSLTQQIQEPIIDLKFAGMFLFLVGISGNFYHHYLLSKLRENKDEKAYKIPTGGLFDLVICPHYLFEIIDLLGISLISQTLFSFTFSCGSAFYLMGRSYASRKWYLSRFPNFPKKIKNLFPFVF